MISLKILQGDSDRPDSKNLIDAVQIPALKGKYKKTWTGRYFLLS